jgi:uncharacterized protein YkwD
MTLPQLARDASSPDLRSVGASSPTSESPSLHTQAATAARLAIAGAAAELNTLRRAADVVAHGLADWRTAEQSSAAKAAEDDASRQEASRQEASRQAAAAAAIAAQESAAAPVPRMMTPPPSTTPSLSASTSGNAAANVDSGAEGRFLALLNDARAQAGLPALQLSGRLRSAAESWAAGFASAGGLRHHDLIEFMDSWTAAGENMAFGPSVDSMFKAQMSSSQHYANIAKPDYTSVGIGVVLGPDGKFWTCQVFAG